MRIDVAEYAAQREIPFLLHFTRAENLLSILQNGLVPRSFIDAGKIVGHVNDVHRLDGRRGANCLSISFPNNKMFYKYRMDDESVEWPILAIHPKVLSELDCMFCFTNAAKTSISEKSDEDLKSLESFRAMYEEAQVGVREDCLKVCDPTDVQAEVLVAEVIPPEAIYAIVFPSNPCLRTFHAHAGGRELLVNCRRGLYGTREYYRRWGYGK